MLIFFTTRSILTCRLLDTCFILLVIIVCSKCCVHVLIIIILLFLAFFSPSLDLITSAAICHLCHFHHISSCLLLFLLPCLCMCVSIFVVPFFYLFLLNNEHISYPFRYLFLFFLCRPFHILPDFYTLKIAVFLNFTLYLLYLKCSIITLFCSTHHHHGFLYR